MNPRRCLVLFPDRWHHLDDRPQSEHRPYTPHTGDNAGSTPMDTRIFYVAGNAFSPTREHPAFCTFRVDRIGGNGHGTRIGCTLPLDLVILFSIMRSVAI
jgi:hypothetical protein